jgi:hypothetical protein
MNKIIVKNVISAAKAVDVRWNNHLIAKSVGKTTQFIKNNSMKLLIKVILFSRNALTAAQQARSYNPNINNVSLAD